MAVLENDDAPCIGGGAQGCTFGEKNKYKTLPTMAISWQAVLTSWMHGAQANEAAREAAAAAAIADDDDDDEEEAVEEEDEDEEEEEPVKEPTPPPPPAPKKVRQCLLSNTPV